MPWIVTSTERVCVPAWSIHFLSRWTSAPDRALLDVTGDAGQPSARADCSTAAEARARSDQEQDQAEPVAAPAGSRVPKVAGGTLIGPSVPAHVSMVASQGEGSTAWSSDRSSKLVLQHEFGMADGVGAGSMST